MAVKPFMLHDCNCFITFYGQNNLSTLERKQWLTSFAVKNLFSTIIVKKAEFVAGRRRALTGTSRTNSLPYMDKDT